MRERLARSVFWLVWSRGLVQGVSLLSTLLVARMLSPTDYGLMALATIWTSTLALVAELGLGAAIIQFPDLEAMELNFCFWLSMALAGAGYLSLAAASPSIAAWFATPRLSEVLRVGGLTLPLVALRLVPEGLLRKRMQIDKISQAEVVAVLLTLPVVLGMAWHGAGVWALVVGALVLPLVQLLAVFRFVRWWPGVQMGSRRLGALIRYGFGSLGARASWAVYEQVDNFVLGRVAGGVVLGFYTMAKTLAILPVVKITVVVNQVAMPVMAGLQADRSALRASFLRGLRLVACFTIPGCIGAALIADDLVLIALGAKWQPMVPLLRVLALFGLIRSLDALLPPILFARYRPAFLFWWTGALLLIMPFAYWIGAVQRGALGVALALVVVYPIIMVWMAHEAFKELALDWKTVAHQLWPIMGATLVMAAVVSALHGAVPASDSLARLGRLVLTVVSGALVYAVAILRWNGSPAREVADVIGWLFPRRPSLRSLPHRSVEA